MRYSCLITFKLHTRFMSAILYYSKHCRNCQSLLSDLRKRKPSQELHYLSVDKREIRNGKTVLLMEDGETVPLPGSVTRVPALLLLERGCMCIYGEDVRNELLPPAATPNRQTIQAALEPDAFSFGQGALGGVSSDNYSFWDQSAQDLEAKGSGGLRQRHHYAGLTSDAPIKTPPDTWAPDKVSSGSVEKIEAQRNQLDKLNSA